MLTTFTGGTLVWVAVLVVIVVYNFSLTAFALYRSTLDPYGELPFFGYNLLQTFVVILRYGIIGELYEVNLLFILNSEYQSAKIASTNALCDQVTIVFPCNTGSHLKFNTEAKILGKSFRK